MENFEIITKPAAIPLHITNPIKFVNTRVFCEAGLRFLNTLRQRGKGSYCDALVGSQEYDEFWDEEERRCLNGYTVGGVTITGKHYAYLNYAIIKMTLVDTSGKKSKKRSLPRFLDMDYYYYHEQKLAEDAGEGIIVAKSRRKGFSFKGAFDLAYEYEFVRDSYSIVGAYEMKYSTATMAMALDMLNHIDENTAFSKRRLINTNVHVKSGYTEIENGKEIEKGFRSEIQCMSFKNSQFNAVGKSASKMLFEEAGKFNNLIASYELSKYLFSDGDDMIGMPIIYGTGGDMEGGTVDFENMFYNPRAYGLRAYSNIYDEDAIGECGLFIDDLWYKMPYVDSDGNSDRVTAKKAALAKREKNKGKTKQQQDLNNSQEPFTPQEAFTKSSGNIFPTTLLKNQLAEITVKREYKNVIKSGRFKRDLKGNTILKEGRPIFEETGETTLSFPLIVGDDTDGCIIIIAEPVETPAPRYLYIGGLDSYDMDKSQTGSLGALGIWKRYRAGDPHNDMLVATYVGRPKTANLFYQGCLELMLYYNAITLYENQNKGIQSYLENKGFAYLLADTPDLFVKSIITNSRVSRGKGIHMTKTIKDAGELLVRDWLLTEYTDGATNVIKLYEKATISELIRYDNKNNFDRAIMLFLIFIFIENLAKVIVREREEDVATKNNDWNLSKALRRK